jgi:tRNA-specific 2-thiouridylase
VGQRRGLQLGGGPARYVRRIDAAARRIVVGPADELAARGLVAEDVHWTGGAAPAPETRVAVRIRHRHAAIPCSVASVEERRARIAFTEPGPAVTPGQAAVVYDGDWVLGGGWIAGELS